MSRKIVLLGAGSAVFTTRLIADLIRSGEAWDLGLVDIMGGWLVPLDLSKSSD